MTASIDQNRHRTAGSARRSLAAFGAIVLDAVEATRSIHSAHSRECRRAVLDRFAADIERDTDRAAA